MNSSPMRLLLCLLVASAVCAAAATGPNAQTYPSKPVRIVVPFAPGGGIDALARAIADAVAPRWGQPIVVENKPGAAGVLGTETAARATPDGHTLLLTAESTVTSNPFLFDKLSYDPVRDLAPIMQLVSLPQMVVARADVAAGTLAALAAEAKAKPNTLNYASYGSGSLPHLFFAGFNARSGTDLAQIPYKGIVPAVTALVAGEVHLTLVGATLAGPHVRSGKLKPLAIARTSRLPTLPDLPTIAEAGYADADPGESWFGLFATGGTPARIIEKVHGDVLAAFAEPAFRDRHITQRGLDAVLSTPQAFTRAITADMAVKQRLIKLSGAKAE